MDTLDGNFPAEHVSSGFIFEQEAFNFGVEREYFRHFRPHGMY